MKPARTILSTLLLTVSALPAAAATVNLQAGASASGGGDREGAPALFLQAVSERPYRLWDRFELRPFATVGVIGGRNDPGEGDAVVLAGGGVRIGFAGGGDRGWFGESQVFLNAGETSSLSGHLQFGNGIGYRWQRAELMVKHISNARLKGPNHGETMLLAGVRF